MSHASLPFVKMHGLGNDFVILDARKHADISRQLEDNATRMRISDRRFGIGCDQLIVLEHSDKADLFMGIYNPDGSEAEACGNATRCVAWLEQQALQQNFVSIDSKGGILAAKTAANGEISVDMGRPRLTWQSIPLRGNLIENNGSVKSAHLSSALARAAMPAEFYPVNMGNPHAVFFVESFDHFTLETIGPLLETDPIFPQKANISFAKIENRHQITLKVWERSAGITLACGSAACATAIAANLAGFTARDVAIDLPGGRLSMLWNADDHIIMTGPVATAFSGEISPSLLRPSL